MFGLLIGAVIGAVIAFAGIAVGARLAPRARPPELPERIELSEAERREYERATDLARQYENLMAYDGRPQSEE